MLETKNDLVLLRSPTSRELVGMVVPEAGRVLSRLALDFQVTLTAMLVPNGDLNVTLYGLSDRATDVGQFLAEKDMWLQPPSMFDFAVPYTNPQYLSKPGAGQHTVLADPGPREPLVDEFKTRIQGIFDESSGPNSYREVSPSARLRTALLQLVLPISLVFCFRVI